MCICATVVSGVDQYRTWYLLGPVSSSVMATMLTWQFMPSTHQSGGCTCIEVI